MDDDPWLSAFIARENLSADFAETARAICGPLVDRIVAAPRREPGLVVGICGAQGSGKSTLSAVTQEWLRRRGLKVALLSLDDIYLTREERAALAREVHPLLATRGVPGTHDAALGERVLASLARPGQTAIPSFDKGLDDRRPEIDWPRFEGPADVILFEGWCVGARPQAAKDLAAPINTLEAEHDADGVWRAYVNAALADPYRRLFGRIDILVMLQAPSFDVVLGWRQEQEAKLRQRAGGRGMNESQVAAFVAHYERLTRHILAEMPGRADVVVRLDAERRPALGFPPR